MFIYVSFNIHNFQTHIILPIYVQLLFFFPLYFGFAFILSYMSTYLLIYLYFLFSSVSLFTYLFVSLDITSISVYCILLLLKRIIITTSYVNDKCIFKSFATSIGSCYFLLGILLCKAQVFRNPDNLKTGAYRLLKQ